MRRRLTQWAERTGPNNPLTRLMLRRRCHPSQLSFGKGVIDIRSMGRIIRIAKKHFLYATDISRSFDIYFSQVRSEQIGEDCVVDYSGPRLHQYANGLEFEIASIPEELEAIDSYFRGWRPDRNDTIFDIGAYCGVSAYYFSQAVPDGKVYAFEPDHLNYSLLLRNIERHELKNVVAVNAAIAARSGTDEFSSEGTMASSLKRHSCRATTGTIESVATLSFADACAKYGTPVFAKVDIEGSEIEMLSAAQVFLKDNSIQFALDTSHWVGGKPTNAAVEKIFSECGYEAESSADSGCMTTWARRRSTSDKAGNDR